MLTLEVSITGKDMFDYNFYHNYRQFSGILSFLLGVLMLVLCVMSAGEGANISYVLITGFLGVYFTFMTPVRILFKSYQQVQLTPTFKKPISYTVTEEELIIEQDGVKGAIPMDDIVKAVDTGKSIILYVSRVRAYIFPKRELGDKQEQFVDILKKSKIRKVKL